MRAMTMWSRVLVVLSLFSLTAQASPPDEPGTQVSIKLAEASGQLPEPEKLVDSLKSVGGEHQVRLQRREKDGQQELTHGAVGRHRSSGGHPQTLREAFPVLATADIQVSTLNPKDRPKFNPSDLKELQGEKGTVKKVVKIIKKE